MRPGDEDSGELPPRVAAAMSALRSERELRRFFSSDLAAFLFSSGGGDAPIGLSLAGCPFELEGRSSNAPKTVGLSRATGRLFGDSMDLERLSDALEWLDESIGSPVAVL